MKTIIRLAALVSLAASSLLAGCSDSREVEAKGEVQAPTGVSAKAVLVEFYDLPKEQGGEEKKVDSITLDAPGAFSQKIDVSGDKIRVFALADLDGDGKCSAGEAWTSAEVRINDDDTLEPLTLTLRAQDCPAP